MTTARLSSESEMLQSLHDRLQRMEAILQQLVGVKNEREFYSTTEVARILGKAEFTVREWCRLSRCRAVKRPCGRGSSQEWMISREELARIQSNGLLPVR